jgi:glycosyltransferase involved in cell wall biosynthesis
VTRVLILSWEYPPLIEGGLARHVRKLSEGLTALDAEVHVLSRGDDSMLPDEELEGVQVHRVREPTRPRDLGEFVAWVEHMNADMLAAGVELGDGLEFDLVHGHDWQAGLIPAYLKTIYGQKEPWRGLVLAFGPTSPSLLDLVSPSEGDDLFIHMLLQLAPRRAQPRTHPAILNQPHTIFLVQVMRRQR